MTRRMGGVHPALRVFLHISCHFFVLIISERSKSRSTIHALVSPFP